MVEDDAKTLWCGNLSEQVNEELLYELFLQAGPLEKVRIPRERDGRQKNFAFITFHHEVSVPYAINLLQGTSLFNRTLTLQCRNQTVSLPPPIRCSSDPSLEFSPQILHNQFSEMSDFSRQHSFPPMNGEPHQQNAAYRDNWGHRQHPYRSEEMGRSRGGRHRGHEMDGGRSHHGPPKDKQWEGRREPHDRRQKNHNGRMGRRKR